MAVERLEGRTLLSTAAVTPPGTAQPQVQPMGLVRNMPVQEQRSQAAGANVGDAVDVGKQYTGALFASGTRRVGWHYLKAAFQFDINSLSGLGHTREVKRVGQNFTNLGRSSQIQAIGHSFDGLGNSISKQWQRVFG